MTRRPPPPPSDPDQPPLRDWHETVVGGKYVRLFEKHVQSLRDESPHGNRELFLDDVFVLSLLAFHNASIRSLRTFEDFSETRQARKFLSVTKVCRSTLSDFHKLAAPTRLEPLVREPRAELARKQVLRDEPADLNTLLQRTISVDGTWMPAMADVTWAVASRNQHATKPKHRARLDFQVDVQSHLPEVIVIPDPGESESESAAKNIQPNHIHLYDRGFSSFELNNAHYERDPDIADDNLPAAWTPKAEFVIRYKQPGANSPELRDAIEKELTDADRAAGIISDRTGTFSSSSATRHTFLPVKLREVVIQTEDNGQPSTPRLITNLLDIPAATIGLLYRQRWQVELFFRWLKSVWNFRHLISHTREGLLTQLYVTLIGVMLLYLHTGYRPSKYMFALLSTGAGLDEILPILRKRERENELARKSAARRLKKTTSRGRQKIQLNVHQARVSKHAPAAPPPAPKMAPPPVPPPEIAPQRRANSIPHAPGFYRTRFPDTIGRSQWHTTESCFDDPNDRLLHEVTQHEQISRLCIRCDPGLRSHLAIAGRRSSRTGKSAVANVLP